MFLPAQVSCMQNQGVNLTGYTYMADQTGDQSFVDHANARQVYARLTGSETPRMPMGGPYWTDQMLAKYQSWMTGGFLR